MKEYIAAGLYLLGSIAIVIVTLCIGWIVVWKFVLSKIPFIQELFELNTPPNGIASERLVKAIITQNQPYHL